MFAVEIQYRARLTEVGNNRISIRPQLNGNETLAPRRVCSARLGKLARQVSIQAPYCELIDMVVGGLLGLCFRLQWLMTLFARAESNQLKSYLDEMLSGPAARPSPLLEI